MSQLTSIVGISRTTCDDNYYNCAVYFMLNILTSTAFGDIVPADQSQMVFTIVLVIISNLVMAIFIGDITNAIESLRYQFLNFDDCFSRFKVK